MLLRCKNPQKTFMYIITLCCCLSACAKVQAPFLPTTCNVLQKTTTDCHGTPTLESGAVTLHTSGQFTLVGHYAACHQIENVEIHGRYQLFLHANGADIELLGISTNQGEVVGAQPRTIGIINLDTRTGRGRIIETAALIRSRGQLQTAPTLAIQCEI